MNKFKKIIVAGSILVSPLIASAGGWTSGGGELIRDSQNPWFLSNTAEVRYCIQVNEKDFGQNISFARTQVQNAISFWQRQLKDLTYTNWTKTGKIELATQKFTEVACGSNVDLTFQFATLSQTQIDRMGDLSKTVAVTIRTDYDLVNLKAKGFVYINKNAQFPEAPWTRLGGARVLPILIHEMGHVFGLQHSQDVLMMKEDFADDVLRLESDSWISKFSFNGGWNVLKLFKYSPQTIAIVACAYSVHFPEPQPKFMSNSLVDKFFGAPAGDDCQSFQMNGANSFIFKSGKTSATTSTVGSAQMTLVNSLPLWGNTDVAHIWLPKEQKVYCDENGKNCDSMTQTKVTVGSFIPKQIFKGTYQTLDGRITRQLGLEVTNSGSINRMSGTLDDILYMDLQAGY